MTHRLLAFHIAWRYLMAPKTHGAVSAISIISVVGVAVATAAIVVVLSVFNGFRFHLNNRLDTLTPDISVKSTLGKTISDGDSLAQVVSEFDGVNIVMPEVSDNALIIAGSKEMPITLRGVDLPVFSKITSIDSLLLDGTPIRDYTDKESSVSVGVAQRLGLYSAGDTLLLFAPKRYGRVNMANPLASFLSDSIKVASVFRSMQNEVDENTVITDIGIARDIFQYDNEATSLLIQTLPGTDIGTLSKTIQDSLGDEYTVKSRYELQETSFRMVAIEKWITFILLSFILLIASFNIISTLCMIILDKGSSIQTFSYLGMSKGRVGRIFWWESVLVTLFGAFAGIVIGIILSLLQEKFGFIKLAGDPESLVILAYPVRVEWLDLGVTLIPIAIIGLITAWISAVFARTRLQSQKS